MDGEIINDVKNENGTACSRDKNLTELLTDRSKWPYYFLLTAIICIGSCIYLGGSSHFEIPPLTHFVGPNETIFIDKVSINKGEEVFHLRGLMNWGSYLGDGAERGPDFTADSLHRVTLAMMEYYEGKTPNLTQYDKDAIHSRVVRELRANTYDKQKDVIPINEAQMYAFDKLYEHYTKVFTDANYPDLFATNHLTNPEEIKTLSTFFFWGAWICAASRPGTDYSYTHNWPFDPLAGNYPTSEVILWSVLAIFCLFLGIGIVLYIYGQMRVMHSNPFKTLNKKIITTHDLEESIVRPTQKSTYKFFVFVVILFTLQTICGILSSIDFVRPFGFTIGSFFTVTRSFHCILQIYWFFMCWAGYTIFFLPRVGEVPFGQQFLINFFFFISLVVGAGALIGIPLGQQGIITGEEAYWFGSQGWEFMEIGRFFQYLMLFAFVLWIYIIYRGVKSWLTLKHLWSVPAWLLYGSGVMVLFLFFGLAVTPNTHFIIADFWRWMVVHMWVEVTFEVFTTVIMGYLMVEIGIIDRHMAERVIFLAVSLFFLTAIPGVAHNFYWIAKPTGVIALGSVFSTLQVLPLLLLTLDAWRLQQERNRADQNVEKGKQKLVMSEVFLFILGVNFWNVFGAGMFGSMINLPIVNYFEHATYLTGNHAHAAMFGVKGNVALAGLLFCSQHLIKSENWNPKLIKTIFWSLNIGVALMMFMDLFPVGVYQLIICLKEGFWAARSTSVVMGKFFKTFTYFRSFGGILFFFGGVLPLAKFVIFNAFSLKEETKEIIKDKMWTNDKFVKEIKQN